MFRRSGKNGAISTHGDMLPASLYTTAICDDPSPEALQISTEQLEADIPGEVFSPDSDASAAFRCLVA